MRNKWKKDEELNLWQPASGMFSALFLVSLLLILLLGLNMVYAPEYSIPNVDAGDGYVDVVTDNKTDLTDDIGRDRNDFGGDISAPFATEFPVRTPTPISTPDNSGIDAGSAVTDDKSLKAAVYVMMVDAETGLTVKEPGVQFELYDENGALQILNNYYPEHIALQAFETAETGAFFFPEKLKTGAYFLHELTEPEGYDTADYQYFLLQNAYDWSDPYVVQMPIHASRNVVRVQMTDADTGSPVSGGSFDLIADEDIITSDGTIRFRKGEIAGEIVIDEEGSGASEPVYLGKYLLRQWVIPDFYTGLQEAVPVVVEKKSEDPPALYTVENLRTRVRFSLTDELYPTKAVANAEYRVTADRGSFAPLDVRTGADGSFVLDELPKDAAYRIRQISVPGDYLLSGADYTVTVDAAGYIGDSNEALIGASSRMLRVTLGITDELSSIQIPNVNLALFDMDDRLIRTWTSSGSAQMFTDLKAGSYYLIKDNERDNHYDIRVVDQAEIQKINIHTTYFLRYAVVGASAVIALACFIGLAVAVRRRKKKARARTGS